MRKLLSPRKFWKFFTNTLQSKLHKLNRSKVFKKPAKARIKNTTAKKLLSWRSFSFQSPRRNPKYRFKPMHKLRRKNQHYLQKRPSPVYVDQLFLEHESVEKEILQGSDKEGAVNERRKEACSTSASSSGRGQKEDVPGTSKQYGEENEAITADDMWETLVVASPLTHGINERAEEFITRFRAEMQRQETFQRQ